MRIALLLWPDTFEDWYEPLGIDRAGYLESYESEWSITFGRMLGDAGCDVHFVFPTLGRPAIARQVPSDATVHFVRSSPVYRALRNAVWGHRWWERASAIWPVAPVASTLSWRLMRAIIGLRPDVVVVQDYESLRFDVAGPLLSALGARVVAMDLGGSSAPRRGRWHRWASKRAHRLLTLHELERGRAVRELGHPDVRTWTVPVRDDVFSPIDRAAARRRLQVGEEARLVVAVGRLHPVKDLHLLVDACLGLEGVELVLAGAGPELASLERRAEPGRLRLVGWVAPSSAADWYAAADIVALSSRQEGQPIAVLEAFACGRGVVATAVGGVPEVVLPGDTGWLVPSGDVVALRAALAEALADVDEADRRGSRGRQLVLERYTVPAATRELLVSLGT